MRASATSMEPSAAGVEEGPASTPTPGTQGPPSAPVIEIERLSKAFHPRRLALDDVSVRVGRGRVLGLLGHNGAGKTTLIRVLSGLFGPDSGGVRVLGHDPQVDGDWVRRRIGVLPATGLLDPRLTAWENIEFAGAMFGLDPAVTRSRGMELLHEFGLAEREHDLVSSFSSGMKQRAALARVLLPEPEVLVLDEPTAALDPVAVREVRTLIQRLSREHETTVVLCTHDLSEAAEICDEVLILSEGRALAHGSPTDLVRSIGLPSRTVVDVGADDAERALAALGADQPARISSPGRLELAGLERTEIAGLIERLSASGLRIYDIDTTHGSLEDLYMALHRSGHSPSVPEEGRA